jgi:hypothetical protein
MTERVSIINGKLPILIVCPHGFDGNDQNTSIIAESIAKKINAYAVINRGWERSDKVDCMSDKADCNNINHCHEDVVKEEFLDPILRYKNRIIQKYKSAYIFYIHGMGNRHRKISGDDSLDMVVGYGAGSPNSFTCNIWQKNLFCHLLNNAGINAFEGKKGGMMSGWSRLNMNQLFRKWYFDPYVFSMQLEIIHDLRNCKDMAKLTAEYIGDAMENMLTSKSEIVDQATSRIYKSY